MFNDTLLYSNLNRYLLFYSNVTNLIFKENIRTKCNFVFYLNTELFELSSCKNYKAIRL